MNDTVADLLSHLPRKRGAQLVFPSPRNPGQRMRDHKVGFATAVRHARIPYLRFHDLRGTFATRLVMHGTDLVTVQKLLGHARIAMIARHYTHSLMDDRMAAVKRLEGQKIRPVTMRQDKPLIGPRPRILAPLKAQLSVLCSVN